jgi:hypothetical protein
MTNKICKLSLFSAILACISAMPVDAAVKTKNSSHSYAGSYQQVNSLRYQQELAANSVSAAAATLPVMVDDERLANSIVSGQTGAPSVSELEACSLIYPNGNFRWGIPEYGIQKEPQCIAVVELRDAHTNAVLATTTVAAGQSMKCNIDYFPSMGYNMAALSKVELPADAAPTMEDVEAVMNEEQKQNAGLKIAAGAIIAGVAGNLLAPKEAGAKSDGKLPIGTGKTQLKDTAIGAVTGAGIMAASTYSGKVAGDTIKSTAVNAASGMIIGNMLAGANGGDGVLATTKCSVGGVEHDCVIGNVQKAGDKLGPDDDNEFYIISINGKTVKGCKEVNEKTKCTTRSVNLVDVMVKKKGEKPVSIESLRTGFSDQANSNVIKYEPVEGETDIYEETIDTNIGSNTFFKIDSANKAEKAERAYAVFDTPLNKALGYKASEYRQLAAANHPKLYFRNYDGSVGKEIDNSTNQYRFNAVSRDADDGGLVDMSNQARAKGTIVGTATGGALGGFAGYQGAKTEVSERWTSALREYEDSLSNFVCVTGGRFLSQYNDYADIPSLKVEQK